ncbi:hypothetical protein DSOUD_1037 [Desulfuromonas soudanensis]|uniref:Uncharacterized protein n=1 Tax=Desulfuromonas soudanensis TaxID=1603606 RepID=A0A0M3QFC1_9BACT|nr:hypothetical protein [Desulfuromonas soudanensis]ALC15823.1 hypothetical protein DSOUD_1037 [Desulfuromonas soudanensis]
MPDNQPTFRHWAPDFDGWPNSWMGVREDLVFGRKLLSYFAEFLQALYVAGVTRRTFVQYRDNLWLLGGIIISRVSLYDDYQADPLATLIIAVEMDDILPDHHHRMNQAELRAFSRMCRLFEKHLRQSV